MIDLEILHATDPWDWPENTPALLLESLKSDQTTAEDLLKTVEMAGEYCVINDELAMALLDIVGQDNTAERIRGLAAIALGPAMEEADTYGFDDPDDVPISETSCKAIQTGFETLFENVDLPKEVRRRILEASVRSPHPWHKEAIRRAFSDSDPDWQLTAVFCMQYVHGFHKQILKALESEDADTHYEAVRAAGACALDDAWTSIESLVMNPATDKPLLMAAIEAAVNIRPGEAGGLLADFLNSDDEDILDVVYGSLALAGTDLLDGDDDEEEDFEDDDDWE
ncbi:MAG: hypothetical protein HQ515_05205 [Phycisphaeraceae bacterium]|nr:hypothetical protein [Phycisphaeraceae bacterium]